MQPGSIASGHSPVAPSLNRGTAMNSPRDTAAGAQAPAQNFSPALQRQVSVGSGAATQAIAAERRSVLGQVGQGVVLGVRCVVGLGAALLALGVGVTGAALWVGGKLISLPFVGIYRGAQWAYGKVASPSAEPAQGSVAKAGPPLRVDREVAAQERFKAANPAMVQALATQPDPSHLGNEAYPRVIEKLVAHGKGNGVTEAEVKEWVVAGENIARALQAQQPGERLCMKTQSGPVEIKPCVYTVRALAWYVAAQTARQDVAREDAGGAAATISDLTKSGSCVMKDPGNKIYDFLRSAPSCAPRVSTHFADRQDGGKMHLVGGLIPAFTKKEQHGIEDYCSKMPGPGGTLLFEKLRPSGDSPQPELFMKFESAGCPPFFGDAEPHHTRTDRVLQLWYAGKRNLRHTINFHHSTKAAKTNASSAATGSGLQEVQRQEHVHKGYLAPVFEGYKKVLDDAKALDVLPMKGNGARYTRGQLMSGLNEQGLPFVKEIVEKMAFETSSMTRGDPRMDALVDQVVALEQSIASMEAQLGAVSKVHGIERRGAETHLNLHYDWNHAG